MKVDQNTWTKVGGIAEATYVNIIHKKLLPRDFDLEELKSICYLECGYLIGNYKPGPVALTTYVYEFLEKRVVAKAWKEWNETKKMHQMLNQLVDEQEEDANEQITRHQHGEYEIEPYKSLADHLEDKDLNEQVKKVADENDLGDLARMLETMTQKEIAEHLGTTQPNVHKKIEKLRKLCRDKGI